MTSHSPPRLHLVTAVNRLDVFSQYLAASPCLQPGGMRWSAHFNASSAADAFNAALGDCGDAQWLVWAHQDVFLPGTWGTDFAQALARACERWPALAVAGVYGLTAGENAAEPSDRMAIDAPGREAGVNLAPSRPTRAGQVLDRGVALCEAQPLPCPAHSLDELLVAVRVDSGLRMDPALGHDFYATDLVLQARERGLQAAVLPGWCEHWSDTPVRPPLAPTTVQRIARSGAAFERKWAHVLPVTTPCFHIAREGDVAAALSAFV